MRQEDNDETVCEDEPSALRRRVETLERELAEARASSGHGPSPEGADLFDAVFNGIDVGLFVVNVSEGPSFRFEAINSTQESLMGITNDAVSGRAPRDLEYHFGKPVVDRIVGLYIRCVRERRPIETLLNIDFPGPDEWWVNRVAPLVDKTGVVYRLVGTSTRLTERKRIEDALRKSESVLRTIIENSAVSIVLVGPDGVPVVVNRAFERLLGYSTDELRRMPFSELTHPEDFKAEIALFREVLEGRRDTYTLEKRSFRKDGASIWVKVSARAVRDDDGRVTHLVVVGEDITPRKAAEAEKAAIEAQYRQSHKMEAVGQLAGGIAHDFNNLLTVVTGYADMALLEMNESDPLRRPLKQILDAGDKATTLTRQLLAFSRKQMLDPKPVDLDRTIRELAKILKRLIGENIQLRTHLAGDLGYVHADPSQLEQVVMNLVVNGRDAMPDGGVITVETCNLGEIHIPSDETGGYEGPGVALAVSDTGTGMSPEIQERVFEPFFTTKEKGKGSGLGLAVVYGIVKQSAGHIAVESEPGRGTTFRIVFPRIADEEIPEVSSASAAADWRGNETILVVEDEDSVRELVVTMLSSAGYTVVSASNAGEAILECEKHADAISLMVTDIVMPKMTGVELSDRLARICPKMKVLFMSGYTEHMSMQGGLDPEGRYFIPKPFTAMAILKKVKMILNRGA